MTAGIAPQDPELVQSTWDLSAIVDGQGDAGADAMLAQASALAQQFAADYSGRVAQLSAAALTQAMRKLATIRELIQRTVVYGELRFSADTASGDVGSLVARIQERQTEVETALIFFELEWVALDTLTAHGLLERAGEELEFAANYLRTMLARKPHKLSESQERIMAERRLTGQQAWERYFQELDGALQADIDGERVPIGVAYNNLSDRSRTTRIKAAEAIGAALAPELKTRTFIFNTLLTDKAVEDRLRGYPSWLSARNLENQASDVSIQALVEAVKSRYDVGRRAWAVKARLLGLDRLCDADIPAPVFEDDKVIGYGEARDIVVTAYEGFSSRAGAIAKGFFDGPYIDAPVRANKASGAFQTETGSGLHPYVMLNYGGRRSDVLTIAHELGHGLHAVLSEPRGIFHQQPPLTIAETASTFGESLVTERLLAAASSAEERISVLMADVGSSVGSVMLQVAFNQFEERSHQRRRSGGELSSDDLTQIWNEVNDEISQGTVDKVPGFERFWSFVPHFFLWPGYVYAYAYGRLFSLAIYARYKQFGADFVPSYLEMLAAGGSLVPQDLGKIVGVDLTDPAFWASGLDLVDAQLDEVEALIPSVTLPAAS